MQAIACRTNSAMHESYFDTMQKNSNLCESCHDMMQKLIISFLNQHIIYPNLKPKLHLFFCKPSSNQFETIILIHIWTCDQMF
jgi:hypothetical protein